LGLLRPHRVKVAAIFVLAIVSVVLAVLAPKMRGWATDEIFTGFVGSQLPAGASKEAVVAGLRAQGRETLAQMLESMDVGPGQGIDFSAVAVILLTVSGVYAVSALAGWLQGFWVTDVVQGTVRKLRSDVEDKINSRPLRYFDRQPRGALLSRVTNDIANIAQSLQQSMSQMITSVLTVVGVLVMMLLISPLLASIALVSIPLSVLATRKILQRSQKLFVDQWRRTGTLNAHVEESYTGHDLIKVFGRQKETHERFAEENEQLFRVSFGAQFMSGLV